MPQGREAPQSGMRILLVRHIQRQGYPSIKMGSRTSRVSRAIQCEFRSQEIALRTLRPPTVRLDCRAHLEATRGITIRTAEQCSSFQRTSTAQPVTRAA